MVKYFEKFTYVLICTLTLSLFSCGSDDGSGSSQNCYNCDPEEPTKEFLSVKVTINSENRAVPITIYNEKYNPDKAMKIVKQDTATKETYQLEVPVNTYYSVRAEYKSGGKTIYAIDGSIFETQKQAACDNECWQMIGGNLDATLKFK
jgi:hypothetical protein